MQCISRQFIGRPMTITFLSMVDCFKSFVDKKPDGSFGLDKMAVSFYMF